MGSSHVGVVVLHGEPAPTHALPLHVSLAVQKLPSLQLPVRFDHAVVLSAGLHSWHSFAGLRTPIA